MASKPKICLGTAAYGPQTNLFWAQYAIIAAELHKYATFVNLIVSGVSNVDINRNKIVDEFLRTDAEWLWWIDADNLPPVDALRRLFAVGEPLVSGLYYGGSLRDEITPIAYLRREDGAYHNLKQIYQWERGEIVPVDAVGMGCFLTHRSVYTDIAEQYVAVQTGNGGMTSVHRDDIHGELREQPINNDYSYTVRKGHLYMPVYQPSVADPIFPFFQCEFNRTEDYVFCEQAKRVGYRILLDTSVEVGHIKDFNYDGTLFRNNNGLVTDATIEEVVHV